MDETINRSIKLLNFDSVHELHGTVFYSLLKLKIVKRAYTTDE